MSIEEKIRRLSARLSNYPGHDYLASELVDLYGFRCAALIEREVDSDKRQAKCKRYQTRLLKGLRHLACMAESSPNPDDPLMKG